MSDKDTTTLTTTQPGAISAPPAAPAMSAKEQKIQNSYAAVAAIASHSTDNAERNRALRALALARSGAVPQAYKDDPAAAFQIMSLGSTLGIAEEQALTRVHMIQGAVAVSSEMMLALFLRAGGRIRWLRADVTGNVSRWGVAAEFRRMGHDPHIEAYNWSDAERAGLTEKGPWQAHPLAMLRARCISAGLRAYAPDVLAGSYDEDEIIPDARDVGVDTAWSVDPEWPGQKDGVIAALAKSGRTLEEFDKYLRAQGHAPVWSCGSTVRRAMFAQFTASTVAP